MSEMVMDGVYSVKILHISFASAEDALTEGGKNSDKMAKKLRRCGWRPPPKKTSYLLFVSAEDDEVIDENKNSS